MSFQQSLLGSCQAVENAKIELTACVQISSCVRWYFTSTLCSCLAVTR